MTLRPHQTQLVEICKEILAGVPIRQIIAAVTPGGGKSKLPVILAEMLIPAIADKILWIAPRNNLKFQGEEEFLDHIIPTRRRMRAANGNEADPCRGTDGYITTYQAIGMSPGDHLHFVKNHRTILFLDESHHIGEYRPWAEGVALLRESAVLVVDASGTMARGDGQKIDGLEYKGDYVNLDDREHVRIIRYTRGQAIRDRAILPVHFKMIDGSAEWENEDGARVKAGSLRDWETSGDALFTALRTEYAYELLDETVTAWRKHRREVYPVGKLLIVAPNIKLASEYQAHLYRRRIDSLIATSEDSMGARESIARFKGKAAPSVDVLDTCQMAYEGMSVKEISHIACLTHIRSVPWLEQCFARANRTAPGKVAGYVFGPDDVRLRAAIASIEAEQVKALAEREASTDSLPGEDGESGNGGGKPGIKPIGSAAFGTGAGQAEFQDEPAAQRPDGGLTPSQAQALLRTQIARHIEIYLANVKPGSKGPLQKIIMRKLKNMAGGKAREDCTVEELTAQWTELRKICPLKN